MSDQPMMLPAYVSFLHKTVYPSIPKHIDVALHQFISPLASTTITGRH